MSSASSRMSCESHRIEWVETFSSQNKTFVPIVTSSRTLKTHSEREKEQKKKNRRRRRNVTTIIVRCTSLIAVVLSIRSSHIQLNKIKIDTKIWKSSNNSRRLAGLRIKVFVCSLWVCVRVCVADTSPVQSTVAEIIINNSDRVDIANVVGLSEKETKE